MADVFLKSCIYSREKILNYLPAVVDADCFGFSFYMYICYFNILGAGDLSDIIHSVCHAFALNGQVFFGNTCRIYSGLVRFKKRTINMY